MEKQTVIPAIAAIVAMFCTAMLFVMDFSGSAQDAKGGGITMITASVCQSYQGTHHPLRRG
jgi:Na+/H+ antiporter NhaA